MTVPGRAGRTDGRATLMDAAWRELAENGPAGLSLRAVARRAGVSHAAPKHHFGDRAGLLTALAVVGFGRLRARIEAVAVTCPPRRADRLAALGRAYLDFSLAEPVLFDVMFGTEPLREDDPELAEQRASAFGILNAFVTDTEPSRTPGTVPDETLMVFSLIHGLVVLTRDGSLQRVTGTATAAETAQLARTLTTTFTGLLGAILPPS